MGGSRRVPLPSRRTTGKAKRVRTKPATAGPVTAKAKPAKTGPVKTGAVKRKLAKPAPHAGGAVDARPAGRDVATYVYGVVRAAAEPAADATLAIERLPGGGGPRLVPIGEAGDCWLIVADVPRGEFGQRALARRLADLAWVSHCGAAHQSALEAYLRRGAVVPMTLLTIFDTDDRALEEIARDMARIDAGFDRVAGRTEWVVRVLRGDAATVAAAAGARETVPDTAAPGRAFLQAKVDQRQAARRAAHEIDAAVRALMQGLSEVADDARDRTEAAGVAGGALLDAAFLVPADTEVRFERAARRLATPLMDRGLRVSVTGPWPCYSFVADDATRISS